MRRASATQPKCCKIQAPRRLRENGPGRTDNVHFLLVFTRQSGPPIQKPIIKSLILMAAWLRPPAPASAQQPSSIRTWRPGRVQDGRCQFSIGFYRSKWPSYAKAHCEITKFEGCLAPPACPGQRTAATHRAGLGAPGGHRAALSDQTQVQGRPDIVDL